MNIKVCHRKAFIISPILFFTIILSGLLLTLLAPLSAQSIPIAVMELKGRGISLDESAALTDRLRNEIFRLGTYDVVERGLMEDILTEQDFQLTGCTSNECLVEVGRLLGARHMVGGSISKVAETFTVSARLVDVETGKVLQVSDYDLRGDLDQMLTKGMSVVASQLATAGELQTPSTGQPAGEISATSGQRILEKMTELLNVTNAKSVMTQTIQTSSGQLRTFELESYSANKGEKTLMRYRKPASVKGQAFLMLNHADDIWTYFPRTKRVRKLASHAKKQSVQGSDFTYEDMGGGDTWKEEFEPTNLGEVELEGQSCWKLQLDGIPEKEPPYPRMVIIVRQEDYHPLQVDYYSDRGDVMKSLYMGDIQEMDGIPTAMKLTMRNHGKGTETKMEILSITYDWEPPKGFFSERNLKK